MRISSPRESGATSVEYAFAAALIAVVIITAVTLLGTNLGRSFDCTATKVDALPATVDC